MNHFVNERTTDTLRMALADLRQIVLNLTQEATAALEQGNLEDSDFLVDRAKSVADLGQKFKALIEEHENESGT